MYIYMTLKFSDSTDLINNMLTDKKLDEPVSYSTDVFGGDMLLNFSFSTSDAKYVKKKLEENLNLDGLDEKEFELLKKSLLSDEIRMRDFIYKVLMNFPSRRVYSEKFEETDTIKALNIEDMKRYISSFDFSKSSMTVITKKHS